MSALFRSETTGIMRRYLYTMSGGESSISGADDNGHTLTYYDGTYVLVWTNGHLLTWNDEYETPDGASVDLLGGRTFASGDEVVIVSLDAFAIADHYTKGEIDADRYTKTEADDRFAKQPGSSTDPGLAFNTWRNPSNARGDDRPTLVEIRGRAETDGTNTAYIQAEVDESGGTTLEYITFTARADANWSNGAQAMEYGSFTVPAGGTYQIKNGNDPNGNNRIDDHREFIR